MPMSVATKSLPAGWPKILDEVNLRLSSALASIDPEIELPTPVLTSRDRLHELARWSERLTRLTAHLEAAEQIVQSVEESLHQEETRMRQLQAACGTLTQRLAAEAKGA
jgi:hypothetical protein